MVDHRLPHLRHTSAGRGGRAQHRRAPALRRRHVQHALEVAGRVVGAGPVGLVDHEHVGDLHEAGLAGLHGIAPPGGDHDHGRVGLGHDVDLHLPDPDRLEDHPGIAGGGEDPHRLGGGDRQSPDVTPRGHGPDEHAVVERVLAHAHPVSEQGAPGERGGRVDRQHGDRVAPLSHRLEQRAGQGRLAGAGRTGDPDGGGVDARPVGGPTDLAGLVAAALDDRDQAGQGAAVARTRRGQQVIGCGSRHGQKVRDRARPTSRWALPRRRPRSRPAPDP